MRRPPPARDALVVQGAEAGGHRGSFDDAEPGEIGLLALLQLAAAAAPGLPLVAAGGIANGAGVAAALAAGAAAAQLGSAFMLTPEAGTSAPHRAALAAPAPTALTRAFSGRSARGIVNRFMRDHEAAAPRAYPEVHHLTAPLRAAARERGDADVVNLWAGQAHELAEPRPAGDLVVQLAADARAALRTAAARAGASTRPPPPPAPPPHRPTARVGSVGRPTSAHRTDGNTTVPAAACKTTPRSGRCTQPCDVRPKGLPLRPTAR